MRKTKILATLGPASNDVKTMKKMIKAGLDAARINFSHGTYESHTETINNLKEARKALGVPIPLIQDTKGPEIRIKTFDTDRIYLEQGAEFTLTTDDIIGNEKIVAVTYADLPMNLREGGRVMIDDGLIELKVRSLTDKEVRCVVVNSGFLSARKGVNIPDVFVNLPSITDQDVEDIKFGIKMGFDYLAASFIRTANDVLNIREVLEKNGGDHIRIISKIESREGVDNIDAILEVSDGIMVARGDLGIELPPEEVPLVQKNLIQRANVVGKPVITATHMLESMTKNPRPTRAEANDVANAIFDGTDVVMLSGETAGGNYPVESIDMMARIALKAESSIDYYNEVSNRHVNFNKNITNAISFAACSTAGDLNAVCIVPITDSGFAARMVSRSRPSCPILAITTNEVVSRQMNLTWGCTPVLVDTITGSDEAFDVAEEMALKSGLAKTGDTIVALAGVPIGVAGTTNAMRVRTVGNVLAKGEGNKKGVVKGLTRVFKMAEEKEPYFERGDIIVSTLTTDDQMEFIKKAGAIIVGSWEQVDMSHAETVAKALDIPLIVSDTRVIDLIGDGIAVTVDSDEGFVYNGFR